MALSRQDAAAALHDIEQAQARSTNLEDYQRVAPHLMIWGVLWAVAYTLNDFYPVHAEAIWSVIVPIGIIAGLVAMRQGRNERTWHYAAMVGAIFIFVVATFVVMWPVNARQVAAFIPLLVALTYVLKGIWSGIRYIGLGIAVSAFTLLSFLLVKDHFFLWMAVVGSGSLILASVLFRRV